MNKVYSTSGAALEGREELLDALAKYFCFNRGVLGLEQEGGAEEDQLVHSTA